MRKRNIIIPAVIALFAITAAYAAEVVDGVVAVVGDEIILYSELQKTLSNEMMQRNMNIQSPRDQLIALRQEVLQGMIDDRLLLEKARKDSVQIDMREVDSELNNQVSMVKQQAGTDEAYRQELATYGISELELRNMWRDMIVKDFLKQQLLMTMTRHISVTPQEIEGWFEANRDSLPEIPTEYKISHILLYPRASDEKKAAAREKLQGILDRVKAGEDFADLAREYSQDPGSAANGGDLGYFRRDSGFIQEFVNAAFALDKGEVSDIVETVYGYHIIKCNDIRGDQISASHILIMVSPDASDNQLLVDQLADIRNRILSGEATFEDMAKEYSEDENSSELGGALRWLTKDEIIPEFSKQADQMKVGDISEPFTSQSGFHIIKLDDIHPAHTMNIRSDRANVEELLRQQKTLSEYDRVLNELREETFIDVRLN